MDKPNKPRIGVTIRRYGNVYFFVRSVEPRVLWRVADIAAIRKRKMRGE